MNNLLLIFSIIAGTGYLGWRVITFWWLESAPEKQAYSPPLNVLICARNAAKSLTHHLPEWLHQDYPNYRVWVVNDASTDETAEVLSHLAQKHKHLHILTLQKKMVSGKREALALGLATVPEGQVVLTDADCRPCSSHFLKELAEQIGEKPVSYLGLGLYAAAPHGVQAMVQFETMQTAFLYVAAAGIGQPYMGVGRNMGYPREKGQNMVAASVREKLAGGDDDLAVRSGLGGRFQVIRGKAAWTISDAPSSFSQWWQQKRRHYETSVHYRPGTLIGLGIDQLCHTGLWLTAMMGGFVAPAAPACWISLGALAGAWTLYAVCLWRRGVKINLFKIAAGDFICTFVIPILWLQAILWKPQGRWT